MRRPDPLVLAAILLTLLGGCEPAKRGGYASGERVAIRVVGTPALFAYNGHVAERFAAANPALSAPVVEEMATASALALMCGRTGLAAPDLATVPMPAATQAQATCSKRSASFRVLPLVIAAGCAPGARVPSHDCAPIDAMLIDVTHLDRVQGLTGFVRSYVRPNGHGLVDPATADGYRTLLTAAQADQLVGSRPAQPLR